jgi:CDP-diacylglycerol pyrophosphatase
MHVSMRAWPLVGLVVLASLIGAAAARAADPDALWKITHDRCVVDQRENGKPDPCTAVDIGAGEDKGFVVLKDIVGATQFLLIPTERIGGIESPAVLAPDATNYFAAAWRARSFMEEKLGHPAPRDWVSLAINSSLGRSQNQLHIHIDCIRADVRDLLRAHAGEIGASWAPLAVPLAGHRYSAVTIAGENLDAVNPFVLLADGVEGARADMGSETLVVVGADLPDGRPGFIVLADRADLTDGNRGSGEELQDHSCALARN